MARQAKLVGKGATFEFYSPYHPTLIDLIKAGIPGAARAPVYNEETRKFSHWEVSVDYRDAVVRMCEATIGKPEIEGDWGKPQVVTTTLRVEYVGLPRDRGNIITASGAINHEWLVTFSIESLKEYFNFSVMPSGLPDKYAILGIPQTASGADIKAARKRLARQWHPDICREENAAEMMRDINAAYELLKDPLLRKKYDASLMLTKNQPGSRKDDSRYDSIGWRPPMRCGLIKVEAVVTMGKYTVNKILAWDDIVQNGLIMVSSWDRLINDYVIDWARP